MTQAFRCPRQGLHRIAARCWLHQSFSAGKCPAIVVVTVTSELFGFFGRSTARLGSSHQKHPHSTAIEFLDRKPPDTNRYA